MFFEELQLIKNNKIYNFNSRHFYTKALAYNEFLKLVGLQERKYGGQLNTNLHVLRFYGTDQIVI